MNEARDALVLFMPSGRRGRFPLGTALLQAARQLGVDIDSVCGGRGICGRCQIELTEGQFAKHGITSTAAHITPLSEPERRFADRRGLADGRRLSCHVKLQGDVVIDVPPDSQVHRQVVRKGAQACDIQIDPLVRLCYVEVAPPQLDRPAGDQERLLAALADQWALQNLSCDLRLLSGLQALLRDGQWRVTAAVLDERRVVALWPGFQERLYGVALDIGSTTLSAHLCDLASGEVLAEAGRMNPQIRFGEDLMSRVSWVMMHPGGEAELTATVREAVNGLIADLVAEAGVSDDAVLALTVAANPIMHHLFFGLSPVELGGAPFALAVDGALRASAADLGLAINPGATVYALPCIAGHVGADAAGVLLAEAPYQRSEVSLIVDVGTNAEILLGNRERLLAASSPTGPAFEGAQISSGQRAAPGAIERVRIDRETLEPRFKVIGCALWSDEPGFEEAVAATSVTGICGSGIIEALAELYLSSVIDPDGVIDAALVARTPRIRQQGRTCAYLLRKGGGDAPDIEITQNDVRAVQLAKAALYAGVKLLMARFGAQRVDRIRLAGAFGSFIDVKYAMVLGLIPDCALDQVSAAGNAAGTGARIALLNAASRTEIEALVKGIEKIETATATDFQDQFVNAMAIPHKADAFPNLSQTITLPPPKKSQATTPKRRRRR
ncbi:MAG: ASKHA domain-containing protein [Gammaproteobacteria bacterium]|nr:ASKHA domain-containing protein [Gammaproteobacteria bacterium]